MTECLFCKIIKGDIPSKKVYEDDFSYAFEDISPQAPVHILVIPKNHVSNLLEAENALTEKEFSALLHACNQVAKIKNLDSSGFRLVSNCGENACQSVHHLHFHVLGGKPLSGQMA